jgi:hypothetical protein
MDSPLALVAVNQPKVGRPSSQRNHPRDRLLAKILMLRHQDPANRHLHRVLVALNFQNSL